MERVPNRYWGLIAVLATLLVVAAGMIVFSGANANANGGDHPTPPCPSGYYHEGGPGTDTPCVPHQPTTPPPTTPPPTPPTKVRTSYEFVDKCNCWRDHVFFVKNEHVTVVRKVHNHPGTRFKFWLRADKGFVIRAGDGSGTWVRRTVVVKKTTNTKCPKTSGHHPNLPPHENCKGPGC